MTRTAIEIAKEAQKLTRIQDSRIIVSEAEWELLNEVASDPDRKEHCISVHRVPVYIDKGDSEVVKAPAGPVWGIDLEYEGE